MKTKSFCISAILWVLSLAAYGQGTFIYDQQSSDENDIAGLAVIQVQQPGQSFTPLLSSVGFIRLALQDLNVGNSLGATIYVNLRTDSITGPILSSTGAVFMPDAFFGVTDFFFSTPVSVTPGVIYYFQPVVQSGDGWAVAGYHYNYSGGTEFLQGVAFPGSDLWFREGIVVPEPSSGLLILLGVVALVCFRRGKTRSKDNESVRHT